MFIAHYTTALIALAVVSRKDVEEKEDRGDEKRSHTMRREESERNFL